MPDVPEEPDTRTGGARPPVVTPLRVVIGVCLAIPFAAMLWVSSYARVSPAFIGIPFFYWYQLMWVLITTALTVIAYRLWQHDQRSRGQGEKGGTR